MKVFAHTIHDPAGIHARPAGLLAKEAKRYLSAIMIEKEGKAANALRLMAVMGLGVRQGDTVTVRIEGPDEEMACREIQAFFEEHF